MPNLLKIIYYNDDILRQKAEPIEKITPELLSFIDDLTYTMYEKDGVGLAAPQVNVSKRIFVCDPDYSKSDKKNPYVIINPEIISFEGEQEGDEGCLSLPNIFEKVKRFKTIKIRYKDIKWNTKIIEVSDLFAVIIQHENDHLDGVLFIDRITKLRRMSIGLKLARLAERTNKNKQS
ncbi:MAG: peptide deformylase [Candidatus Cloacimonetes bacterium]|jgi:peptide deformylase|nr:peptide deformylase [Candidatus Cloacimonadota bacterium]MDD4155032.1 peptide deformylase [Candidatus Cloacimonadota bacterium]